LPNSLLHIARVIMKIVNSKNLVLLDTFTLEPFSKLLLENLHGAGFVNPMLFGGALRDDYLRNRVGIYVPTNDYDIYAGLDAEKVLGAASNTKEATANLVKYVQERFSGVVETAPYAIDGNGFLASVSFDKSGKFSFGSVKFSYMGRNIEIKFDNKESALPLEQRLWTNTAPLCAIVTDRSGKVIADENFEKHAQELIFKPYEPDKPGRKNGDYIRLSKKIPGLKYISSQREPQFQNKYNVLKNIINKIPEVPGRINSVLNRVLTPS
jgi:hypothetical protein